MQGYWRLKQDGSLSGLLKAKRRDVVRMQEQKGNRDRWKEVKSKENWDKAVSWINDKKEDEPISIILIFQIL